MEDDNASSSSGDDSLALLPDLKPSAQLNGPDQRAGRAHSALRSSHPARSADKTPSGVSYVDLCFQYNDKQRNRRNSGEKL